jgi:hypothetical protein
MIKVMYYFEQKLALATFWAIISQAHLVTLMERPVCFETAAGLPDWANLRSLGVLGSF